MRYLFLLRVVPALLLLCGTARADLIVDIQDARFLAGGTGFVDVLISSSDTNDLGNFSAKFQITPTSGSGILAFQSSFNSTDALRQSNSERTDDNYVFAGTLGTGFVSHASGNGQTLTQIDRSTQNVTLGNATKLLARLELIHILPTGTDIGGIYEISLVNDASTQFRQFDNMTVPVEARSFASTNFGTITVNAVPEPSSGLLLLVALGIGMRRRRRHPLN